MDVAARAFCNTALSGDLPTGAKRQFDRRYRHDVGCLLLRT